MASGSRQKTTMAKLTRERALRERRDLKQAKKADRAARKREAALAPADATEPTEAEPLGDEELRDAGT